MSASPFALSHSGLCASSAFVAVSPSNGAGSAAPAQAHLSTLKSARLSDHLSVRVPARLTEPTWLRALTIFAIAAVLSLCLPMLAHAGIPNKPATIVTNVVTMLTGLGVGLFTAACMWTGYKMAFAGAQFRDVSNILWGGVLAGGAAGFAGWLFS